MNALETKQKNRLHLSDFLAITSIPPRINKLTDRKQQQNLASLTKTFKNQVVIKETEFDFFNNL
jgi:hypothetical protein